MKEYNQALTQEKTLGHDVLEGCLEACRRIEILLDCLDTHQYCWRPPSGGGTIGEHTRHCLDHFICLLRGVDCGIVEYDARDRDPQLEQNPIIARQSLDMIYQNLSSISSDRLLKPLVITQIPAPEVSPQEIPTTLMRELAFLSSHSIHHLAVMAEIARQQNVIIPEHLTLAYSTAAYRRDHFKQS